MKKLLFLLLFIPLISFGQDYLSFIGDKSYPSTEGFKFKNNASDVLLSFVKTEINRSSPSGTAVYLSTFYLFDPAKIKKQLTLFLDNGDVINSYNAIKTDYVDQNCIALYPLTESDVSALKEHNLIRIRYTITRTYSTGDSEDINRFASNDENISEALKDF